MHEISAAHSIVDHIKRSVAHDDLHRVREVRVRVGDLSGVAVDVLSISFSAIVEGTPLGHAVLVCERHPFLAKCRRCGRTTTCQLGMVRCDHCGSNDTEILSGTELEIVDLALADELHPIS